MSELNDIISQLQDAQSSAQSAESNADDASSTVEEFRNSIDSAVDYANDSSGYANDAAEQIDSVINAIQCYIDAKDEAEQGIEKEEQATKAFIDVLEYIEAKLDAIKSTVASANNLVSNALLDMKNADLPLEERSERLLEASTDEAQEEAAEYA